MLLLLFRNSGGLRLSKSHSTINFVWFLRGFHNLTLPKRLTRSYFLHVCIKVNLLAVALEVVDAASELTVPRLVVLTVVVNTILESTAIFVVVALRLARFNSLAEESLK